MPISTRYTPLWHDTSKRCFMSGKLFLLKFVVRQLDLGRSVFGKRAERVISVKKRRLFDCFKNASPSVFLRYFLTLKSSRNECLEAKENMRCANRWQASHVLKNCRDSNPQNINVFQWNDTPKVCFMNFLAKHPLVGFACY